MICIVCNSQKGGSGKSTVCRVLAVHASHLGRSVFLIDTDTQGTLTQWHEARQATEPQRVELARETLPQGLNALAAQGAEFVFIDTPPNASEHLDDVFSLADLVLVPIKPTPDDLKAALVTVNRLKALRVPFLFVLTQAIQNTNITAQAIAALSHHGPVAESILGNRVAYPSAFTDGRTPQEIEARGTAAKEIAGLWANIQTSLHINNLKLKSATNG